LPPPVSAGGRVYIPGQDGGTVVFKAGPALEVIATSQLDDAFDASPALVDNELFLGARKLLYAIAAPGQRGEAVTRRRSAQQRFHQHLHQAFAVVDSERDANRGH